MNKVTAIIIDDEMPARENLKLLLNDFCPEVEILGMGKNVEEAKQLIANKKPEAVFLDIRMPSGEEGLELLDSINVRANNLQIVFVTAFKELAIKAFHINSIHYLLKPIDIEDLQNAVHKLIEYKKLFLKDNLNIENYIKSLKNFSKNIQQQNISTKITISHTKGIKIIKDASILFLEGDGNCTNIHFVDGSTFFDTRTLKIYEEILNPKRFFRIHKKYMININYLTDYVNENGYFAKMNTDVLLPIARARISEFMTIIKSL